jgi:hypothetical protein
MTFLTDRRYGWAEQCLEQFGQAPRQVFHEDNRVAHTAEYEGQPGRRPLTYDEVQALFDAVDGRVEQARARGRKGALTALRDAALLKPSTPIGPPGRGPNAGPPDLVRGNPKIPQFRRSGGLYVRYGMGSPPKRRTVLTVAEMTDRRRPRPLAHRGPAYLSPGNPALFVTERASRLSPTGPTPRLCRPGTLAAA